MMNKRQALLLLASLGLSSGCSDYLDVNTNPNAPQIVTANLYLPAMLHWFATSEQFDGRFVGRYTQEWTQTTNNPNEYDRMGYLGTSDNGGQLWRDVYWSLGQNLVDMNNKA